MFAVIVEEDVVVVGLFASAKMGVPVQLDTPLRQLMQQWLLLASVEAQCNAVEQCNDRFATKSGSIAGNRALSV